MNVVMVVGTSTLLTAGDTAIRNRLQTTLGHTVTIVDDQAAAPDLSTTNLVVISASSNFGFVGTKYDAAPCGVLGLRTEPHTQMTDDTFPGGGNTSGSTYIQAPGDPLVGGLTDTINVLSGSASLNYQYYNLTSMAPGAVVVGLSSSGGSRVLLARMNQGSTLFNGAAVSTRRVVWGINDDWPQVFSAAGWTIFDNSVAWASVAPGQTPVAAAGSDQQTGVGSTVQLDGTGSSDTDGTISSYTWRLVSSTGPSVTLSSTSVSSPTFTAPNVACTLVFGLRVTDNDGLVSPEDTVTIDVIARMSIKFAQGGVWTDKPQYIAKSGSWY